MQDEIKRNTIRGTSCVVRMANEGRGDSHVRVGRMATLPYKFGFETERISAESQAADRTPEAAALLRGIYTFNNVDIRFNDKITASRNLSFVFRRKRKAKLPRRLVSGIIIFN